MHWVIDASDLYELSKVCGTSGTQINKTALLLELQDRVSTIEDKSDQVKWIRFFEPNETFTNQYRVCA